MTKEKLKKLQDLVKTISLFPDKIVAEDLESDLANHLSTFYEFSEFYRNKAGKTRVSKIQAIFLLMSSSRNAHFVQNEYSSDVYKVVADRGYVLGREGLAEVKLTKQKTKALWLFDIDKNI